MTDTPFIDHRTIQRLAEQSPALDRLLAQREVIEAIAPITMAEVGEDAAWDVKGYFATSCGRMALRFVTAEEAEGIFGVEALTAKEAIILIDRLAHLGLIEQAAVEAQARAVRLLRAASTMFEAISRSKELGAKERVRIGALLHDIRKEDEARAGQVSAMRAASAEAARDRRYVMKRLGIAL